MNTFRLALAQLAGGDARCHHVCLSPSVVFPFSVARAVAADDSEQPAGGGTPRAAVTTARVPYIVMLSARRIAWRDLPEAVVPYLRMSGRWREEYGFGIGSVVRVRIEHGRLTLISEAAEAGCHGRAR